MLETGNFLPHSCYSSAAALWLVLFTSLENSSEAGDPVVPIKATRLTWTKSTFFLPQMICRKSWAVLYTGVLHWAFYNRPSDYVGSVKSTEQVQCSMVQLAVMVVEMQTIWPVEIWTTEARLTIKACTIGKIGSKTASNKKLRLEESFNKRKPNQHNYALWPKVCGLTFTNLNLYTAPSKSIKTARPIVLFLQYIEGYQKIETNTYYLASYPFLATVIETGTHWHQKTVLCFSRLVP